EPLQVELRAKSMRRSGQRCEESGRDADDRARHSAPIQAKVTPDDSLTLRFLPNAAARVSVRRTVCCGVTAASPPRKSAFGWTSERGTLAPWLWRLACRSSPAPATALPAS